MPLEAYRKLPFPGAEELAEMFDYLTHVQPYLEGPAQSRSLFPDIKSDEALVKDVLVPAWAKL
jgi:hypothetical protein